LPRESKYEMFRRNMSEFKYACPVCGQHIKCDSSQSGTVMECPTCFQKIIVPQAPAGEQTLILTGTKAGNGRPAPTSPEPGPKHPYPPQGVSGVLVVVLILIGIGIAVGFVYHGTIFKSPTPVAAKNAPGDQTKKTAPELEAPVASDQYWTLDLIGTGIPTYPAAGRINGQNFICERATLQGGLLTLRYGDLDFVINFAGANAQMLSGKSIDVDTNTPSAARVVLRWKDGDHAMHETFTNGYALLLDFGEAANNRIPGKIYLCLSDDKKSYVAGTFKAEIRKPKPKKQ